MTEYKIKYVTDIIKQSEELGFNPMEFVKQYSDLQTKYSNNKRIRPTAEVNEKAYNEVMQNILAQYKK